jgi:ABC-type antimicrobial peptide transport system permease subunit
MAARFWPGRDPLGRELKIEGRSRQVVGVVKDSKYGELWESSRPALYLPWSDFPDRAGVLLLRVSSDHIDIARALRLEARTINPRVAIFGFLEMEQHLQEGLSGERLAATLTSVLGAGALLLTGAGIFGLMSFIVTQGRREIGIRLALGAEPGQIARQILGQGLRLCVVGVVLGLVTAIGLTRFIGGLLHGTKPADPGIFAAIAVLVIMTALLACYAPVRRAAKVDPARTLRHE